jgi:hypothetical protein
MSKEEISVSNKDCEDILAKRLLRNCAFLTLAQAEAIAKYLVTSASVTEETLFYKGAK